MIVTTMTEKTRVFTREEIEGAWKSGGKMMLIFEDKVYDVTSWAPRHPGGQLVIRHMIGRDATDQIRVNHNDDVVQKMKPFCVGRIEPDGVTVGRPLSLAFRRLHEEFKQKGFYKTDYSFYVKYYLRFLSLMVIGVLIYCNYGSSFIGCTIAALFMGLFWQQMAFVGHDTGHNGITHDRKTDSLVGIVLGNLLGGISIGWWKGSHNVHHLMTNDPEHDSDIQHLPVFAVTDRFFHSIYSTFLDRTLDFDMFAKIMIPIQHITYYPVMMFGRFNLYLQSFFYLYKHDTYLRKLEIAALALFWCWFITLVCQVEDVKMRLWFVLLSHATTFILHVQITLSHFSMSTEPMGEREEFVRYQLRTTLDVDCPEWLDWFHGGLQFQLAHHLFPRMPRHNLRRARDRIVQFCDQHGLQYNIKTFTQGNMHVLTHLKKIADQWKFMAMVAQKNFELEMEHAEQCNKHHRGPGSHQHSE